MPNGWSASSQASTPPPDPPVIVPGLQWLGLLVMGRSGPPTAPTEDSRRPWPRYNPAQRARAMAPETPIPTRSSNHSQFPAGLASRNT